MTNQHAITDKSTTHSDRRYRQPARDQRAGAGRTYFYVHSKNMAPIFKSVVWWFDDHLMPRKVLLNMISKGLWLDQGSPFLKCVFSIWAIDTIEMRQCVAGGLINDLSTNTDRYCTVNGPFVSVFSTGSRFDPHIPLLRWSFRQKCLQVPLAPVSRSSLSSLIINQTIPFSNK